MEAARAAMESHIETYKEFENVSEESNTQLRAYIILDQARHEILQLPRFKGQSQILAALKRVLNLSVWDK
jgi:hypothetical protein